MDETDGTRALTREAFRRPPLPPRWHRVLRRLLWGVGFAVGEPLTIEPLRREANLASVFKSAQLERVGRVHYACGQKLLPEWVNLDRRVYPVRGYYTGSVDLTLEHPFSSGVLAYAFAEDFLEHLEQSEQLLFLCEVHRTLARGGVLRLSFPGLEGVLKKHYPSTTWKVADAARRDAYEIWGHKHFFSLDELALVCRHLGFSACQEVAYGASKHRELRGLDSRPDQVGLNTYVEVTK